MTTGIWILGDQLWHQQSALAEHDQNRQQTPVVMIESQQHVQVRRYHAQKLVLVWSAMRHFAEELRDAGWMVTYIVAESFEEALQGWLADCQVDELKVMTPNDRPFQTWLQSRSLPCKVTLTPNNLFLWTEAEFQQWAKGRKALRMENFYREGRKKFEILMDGKEPIGGQWNFDKENRKPPTEGLQPPSAPWFEPDEITQSVLQAVQTADLELYGQLEPFGWAVTRDQALQVLQHFVEVRLSQFGTYQDAMISGEETLWHSLISPYLNLGLLHPLEVIQAIESALEKESVPINSVEGFIRQVLGWREYMRGLYHWFEEDYPQHNWFEHDASLPDFFWDAETTDMNCLHQTLKQTERIGYAHHIQRLMILGNFALIAGLSPQEVENWFHAAFIDAYDWVMQTNVLGMGLFADGGMLASKPYAASANYINKMSNYCDRCQYNKRDRIGDEACPFNFFYWDFLDRHREKLQSQGRMSFILKNLDKMSNEELNEIRERAEKWRSTYAPPLNSKTTSD